MAVTEGSAIHVLHAIDDARFATGFPDGFYLAQPGLREQLIEEANARLQALVAGCAAAGVPSTSQTVIGRPAPVIADVA
jgi:nucleotide-binding universal stress UspA family protein